jgi:hypothetical protein
MRQHVSILCTVNRNKTDLNPQKDGLLLNKGAALLNTCYFTAGTIQKNKVSLLMKS